MQEFRDRINLIIIDMIGIDIVEINMSRNWHWVRSNGNQMLQGLQLFRKSFYKGHMSVINMCFIKRTHITKNDRNILQYFSFLSSLFLWVPSYIPWCWSEKRNDANLVIVLNWRSIEDWTIRRQICRFASANTFELLTMC